MAVNYHGICFITLALVQMLKNFYGRKLRIFVKSKPFQPWHSSLLQKFLTYSSKKFITLAPRPNVIKNFADVIYDCS